MEYIIRSGSGLGDNIYLHAIVKYLSENNPSNKYTVRTRWPDIFRYLPGNVQTAPHNKIGCNIVAHYSGRKKDLSTDQYQDMLITAGIDRNVPMETNWRITNRRLADKLMESGKKILVVNQPRDAMGRADSFGKELIPKQQSYQIAIDFLKESLNCTTVMIGSGQSKYDLQNIDIDLIGKTSIADVMDIGRIGFYFIGQCSLIIPLAEIYDKPLTVIWGDTSQAKEDYVRTIIPQKILHGKKSKWVYDFWSEADILDELKEHVEAAD